MIRGCAANVTFCVWEERLKFVNPWVQLLVSTVNPSLS